MFKNFQSEAVSWKGVLEEFVRKSLEMFIFAKRTVLKIQWVLYKYDPMITPSLNFFRLVPLVQVKSVSQIRCYLKIPANKNNWRVLFAQCCAIINLKSNLIWKSLVQFKIEPFIGRWDPSQMPKRTSCVVIEHSYLNPAQFHIIIKELR